MLTPTQVDWANRQRGEDRAVALEGVISAATARKGGIYSVKVTSEDGTATFEMQADAEVAAAHRGQPASVLVDGVVDRVELDEENGRVGLVVVADNGTATDWVVPAMSAAEIEEASRPPEPEPVPEPEPQPQPEPDPEEIAAEEARQEEEARVREEHVAQETKRRFLALLDDPEAVAALKRALT